MIAILPRAPQPHHSEPAFGPTTAGSMWSAEALPSYPKARLRAKTWATMPPDEELILPVSFSPAGSEFSGIFTFLAELSSWDGNPLLLTRWSLMVCG
ncbi:MAG: hypothetical protein ACHQ7M_18555, partial [Chloroflexota bacterium]